MPTPNYLSPIVGTAFNAAHINQFLGFHPGTLLNQGKSQVANVATATGHQFTYAAGAAQWIDQPFTTAVGQTAITRIELGLIAVLVGADTTLELRTDDGTGRPSNATPLWTCNLPADFEPAACAYISIPCNITGLTPNTIYHIMLDGTANATNYAQWNTTANTTLDGNGHALGAGWTSVSGTGSWVTTNSTFCFSVFNGTNGNVRNIVEDCPPTGPPARWTGVDYNTDGTQSVIREVTGTLRSVRTFGYVNGMLVSVT